MLCRTIFIAVVIYVASSKDVTYSSTSQELDMDNILEVLQRHQRQEQNQQRNKHDKRSRYYSAQDDIEDSHFGSLRNLHIEDLIKEALFDSKKNEKENNRYNNRNRNDKTKVYHDNKAQYFSDNVDNNEASHIANQQALEQLLQDTPKKPRKDKLSKKVLIPNDLLGSVNFNDGSSEGINDLSEYSRIYVILNPKAIKKSQNKEKLNTLMSQILSLASENQQKRKEHRYKGFVVKDIYNARRYRRESKERYEPRDSDEDYKPKRSRNDYGGAGGGGGGSGGRTAIPYIGHRGDIYERDN